MQSQSKDAEPARHNAALASGGVNPRRIDDAQSQDAAPLMVSVSGVRGIVGKSLTPQVVTDFAAAYGSTLAGGTVVLSRDGRGTGNMLRHAAAAGLLSVGCRVVDIGVAATPTCGYFVKSSGAAGGIQITASHNPPEWNGMKLFRREGYVVSPEAGRRIADAYGEKRFRFVGWENPPSFESVERAEARHVERVVSLVDAAAIKRRRFKVVLDANHGSGAVLGPAILAALGCDTIVLGDQPDGIFEHPPEPTEANLIGLGESVRKHGAGLGFAVDPDADRLAVVDQNGRYFGEEYTLALAIRRRVMDGTGPVVLNGSTSRVSETAAKASGCPVCRTSVGEVHVADRMVLEKAIIGGEGNGGVIDPRVGLGRDSAAGIALVLDLLVRENRPLSEVVDSMPRFAMRKEKFPVDRERLEATLAKIGEMFADGAADRSDGLRIEWPDAWVQVRASNTEPIVRVIAEADDASRADSLCRSIGRIVAG